MPVDLITLAGAFIVLMIGVWLIRWMLRALVFVGIVLGIAGAVHILFAVWEWANGVFPGFLQ